MTYLNNKEVFDLATRWHEGQKRKDGKDYITHPIAVAEITLTIAQQDLYHDKNFLDTLYQIALLHDVMEDCEDITKEVLLSHKIDPTVVECADILNKNNYSDYKSMIATISRNYIASIVKYADLTHNLSDLQPNFRDKIDKYMLSKYILNSMWTFE